MKIKKLKPTPFKPKNLKGMISKNIVQQNV